MDRKDNEEKGIYLYMYVFLHQMEKKKKWTVSAIISVPALLQNNLRKEHMLFFVCRCGRQRDESSYLVQGESADTESGQFYCVQQGDLGHTIGFCAPTGPILVTLDLEQRGSKRKTHRQMNRQEVLAAKYDTFC